MQKFARLELNKFSNILILYYFAYYNVANVTDCIDY